jgi:hypothetical protein
MDQNQTKTLSLNAAYVFGEEHGMKQQMDEIRNMVIEWDLSYTSSLRRGYVVELFERHGIFDEFKTKHWIFGNTAPGEAKRRRYLRIKQQYEEFLAGRTTDEMDENATDDEDSDKEFAAESDLRDFLAKNPACIESGLCLYHNGDRTGVEFPVANGFIDILAVDRQSDSLL